MHHIVYARLIQDDHPGEPGAGGEPHRSRGGRSRMSRCAPMTNSADTRMETSIELILARDSPVRRVSSGRDGAPVWAGAGRMRSRPNQRRLTGVACPDPSRRMTRTAQSQRTCLNFMQSATRTVDQILTFS